MKWKSKTKNIISSDCNPNTYNINPNTSNKRANTDNDAKIAWKVRSVFNNYTLLLII